MKKGNGIGRIGKRLYRGKGRDIGKGFYREGDTSYSEGKG